MQSLFKAKRTQVEMIRDRGFQPHQDELALLTLSLDDFITYYSEQAQLGGVSFRSILSRWYQQANTYEGELASALSTQDDHVVVIYLETTIDGKQVGVDQIKEVTAALTEGIRHVILISETKLSPQAQKCLTQLPAIWFETFIYSELGFNPIRHELVPLHIPLSSAEVATFLRSRKLRLNQLPRTSKYDPIIRYYGVRVGQIVKVIRPTLVDPTVARGTVVYRAVADVPLDRPSTKTTNRNL